MRREELGAAAMVAVALLACGDEPTGAGGVASRLDIEPGATQTLTAFGQTVQLVAVAQDGLGRVVRGIEIEWESRNPDAATVGAAGLVTARGNGEAFIVARSGSAIDSVRVTVAVPAGQAMISIVSGNDQPGRAGHELAEPFVVRVTNGRGEPLAHHPVLWVVAWGEGLIDGNRLHACLKPPPLAVLTDADGRAQVSFTPTWFGVSLVTAALSSGSGPGVAFTTDASDPEATLTVVSGASEQGKAGQVLPVSLRVRVTDGEGDPVPHVAVTWRVASGSGRLAPWECEFPLMNQQTTTRTRPDEGAVDDPSGTYDVHGVSWVTFLPTAIGRSVVVATLSAPPSAAGAGALVFEIDAPSMVVSLAPEYGTGELRFFGPDPVTDFIEPLGNVTVPVGTTVEWISYVSTARIVSTTTPPGGAAFDSGMLGEEDRFEFVPGVPGAWEFIDQVSGVTGTLTAE